jgi:hypothetical protein
MWGIAYLYPLLHLTGLRRIRHHNTGKPDPWHHLVNGSRFIPDGRADAFFISSLSERLLAAINAEMPSPTAALPNPSESNLNKQASTIPTFE